MTQEISLDETKLYDRQIRLWGMEAQKNLRHSKLLVVGLDGLSNEVLKNICLAGVAHITISEHRLVSLADLADSGQFLVPRDKRLVGVNKAEASREALQKLNPRVNVISEPEDVTGMDATYFSGFDVVYLSGSTLDNICRDIGVKFWCSQIAGLYGFFFSDMGPCFKFLVDIENKDGVTDTVEKTEKYPSLQEALKSLTGWNRLSHRKLDRVVSPPLLAFLGILTRESATGECPGVQDFDAVSATMAKILDAKEIPMEDSYNNVLREILENYKVDFSPVCAAVGGILGQEILKAVSRKDMPIRNFLGFDGEKIKATIVEF